MEYNSGFVWEKGSGEAQSRVSLVLQQAQVRKKSVLLACVCEGGNEGDTGVTESGYFTEGLVEWFHREFVRICERKRPHEEIEQLLKREVARIQGEIGRFAAGKGLAEQLHYWGILLWDNRFWIFARGSCEGYLVNRRFQKKNLRRLGAAGVQERAGQSAQTERPAQTEPPAQAGQPVQVEQSAQVGQTVQERPPAQTERPAQAEQSAQAEPPAQTKQPRELRKQEQWLSGRLQYKLGILLCTSGFLSFIRQEEAAEVLSMEGEITEARLEKRLRELWQENVRRGECRSVGAIYLRT